MKRESSSDLFDETLRMCATISKINQQSAAELRKHKRKAKIVFIFIRFHFHSQAPTTIHFHLLNILCLNLMHDSTSANLVNQDQRTSQKV